MLVNTSTQRNFLSYFGACRAGQAQSSGIGFHGHDFGACCYAADVDHENLVLGQLGYLCLLSILRSDAEKTAQEEVVHLQFRVDGR